MNKFAKMIVAIILIIIALIGLFYVEGSKKSARVADITVFIEVQNESVRIANIEGNLEAISKVGIPVGGLLNAPGIAVLIIQDMKPVSDWYSLPLGESGAYNFRIGLYDSFSEDIPVSVYVQAIDRNSRELMSVQKRLLLNTSSK